MWKEELGVAKIERRKKEQSKNKHNFSLSKTRGNRPRDFINNIPYLGFPWCCR